MLPQERGLIGEGLLDQRRMIDLEMVGVVVTRDAAGRPARRLLNVFRVDESLTVADAYQ